MKTEHRMRPKLLYMQPSTFALLLLITGLIGLIASFELTIDKIHVLKDPTYQPICNINPVFSCKSVMQSAQAEIAGVPNTIFGIVGYSIVIAIGGALLAGARLHRRFWQLWMVGMTAGLCMVGYLVFQSIFRLGTLCIFCMTVWVSTLPLIWYSLLWCVQESYVTVPQRLQGVVRFVRREHVSLLIVVYVLLIALIVQHFWYFFKTV